MEALRERLGEVEFFGCGGDRMRAAGCRTLADARQIAMVGLVEVLPGLPRAWKALRSLRRALRQKPPDLAILIDFPDFNLRLARTVKRAGRPVIYFVAPQVWAWRRGRLKTLRRDVDRLLCIFPFEEAFFQDAGVAAKFVGHPLVGRVAPRLTATAFRSRFGLPETAPLIALLPGSRRGEIHLNLPPMIETAQRLKADGQYHFVIPAASSAASGWIEALLARTSGPFTVVEDHTYDAVAHATVAVVASGTVAVETALLGTPMVIVYRVNRLTGWLGKFLIRTPFYSTVNLVANRQIVPELIQEQFRPEIVAREVQRLVMDSQARERMQETLREFSLQLALSKPGDVSPKTIYHPPKEDAIQRSVAVIESYIGRGVL